MLFNKKLSMVNRWRYGAYNASTAAALPHNDEFNLLEADNSGNSGCDGGSVRLLKIRSISSCENLYQTACRCTFLSLSCKNCILDYSCLHVYIIKERTQELGIHPSPLFLITDEV